MFLRAYLEANEVCFDSPLPIDWSDVASQHFTTCRLASPDRKQLAQHWNEITRQASLPFSAPLPVDFPAHGFIALSERGLHNVRPTHLRGEVSYDLWEPDDLPAAPGFGGLVCGTPAPPLTDVGFVAFGTAKLSVVERDEPTPSTLPSSNSGFDPVQSAYSLVDQSTGASYLFVRRVPDTACLGACCQFAYDLFSNVRELTRLQWNAYSCDP